MVRARRATASWPSRYDTLGTSTESFIAAGGYHHTWNEAGMRILVVEDERKVASFIRQGLEEEGHTVEVAADGAAALDLMVAGPPHDLVVLDLMLPKRDSFEVLRQARSKHVETPVLVLTARDGVSDRVMGLDLGADDYLTKPFAFEEFLARVRALLRRRSASRAPVLRLADLTLDPSPREARVAAARDQDPADALVHERAVRDPRGDQRALVLRAGLESPSGPGRVAPDGGARGARHRPRRRRPRPRLGGAARAARPRLLRQVRPALRPPGQSRIPLDSARPRHVAALPGSAR